MSLFDRCRYCEKIIWPWQHKVSKQIMVWWVKEDADFHEGCEVEHGNKEPQPILVRESNAVRKITGI